MPAFSRAWLFSLAGLLLAASVATPAAAQSVFGDSFEYPHEFPADNGEAARFLNQASFGATAGSVAATRQNGLNAWFDQQVSAAPTLSRPFFETLTPQLNANNNDIAIEEITICHEGLKRVK